MWAMIRAQVEGLSGPSFVTPPPHASLTQCLMYRALELRRQKQAGGKLAGVRPVGARDCRPIDEMQGQEVARPAWLGRMLREGRCEQERDEMAHLRRVVDRGNLRGAAAGVVIEANGAYLARDIEQITSSGRVRIGVGLVEGEVIGPACGEPVSTRRLYPCRHSALGYLSPDAYERRWATQTLVVA
jgi:hypothetical protein